MIRVYVAAPLSSAPRVRDVHNLLARIGCKGVSIWAEITTDPATLSDERARVQRILWELNVKMIDECHAVLVLAEETPAPGEQTDYSDVGRALCLGKPVLWTGPGRILSSYAPDVQLVRCLDDALEAFAQASKATPGTERDVLRAGFQRIACPKCHDPGPCFATSYSNGRLAWQCRRCQALFDRLPAEASPS